MRRICLVLLGVMGCALTGCGSVPKIQNVVEEPKRLDVEFSAYDEGVQAFEKADYDKAVAIFEFLSESTESEAIYRHAVYALACTRLALAQTPEEYNEAVGLWNCWSQQTGPKPTDEDPRMITPFLTRMTLLGSKDAEGADKKEAQAKAVYKNHLVYRDVVVYKNLLQTKEKEIDQLKSRVEAREREVRRLRHQIESLEAIHLKIQEKKKEISSP